MPSPSSFKAQVAARIRELRPAHEEYLALVELQEKLGGQQAPSGNGRRRGRRPGRPASSTSMLGASAHTELPAAKTVSPSRYARLGPSLISSEWTVVAATTDATRYTVVTQA